MSIYMILIDIHIYQRHNINQFLVDFIITQNFDRKTFTFSIKKNNKKCCYSNYASV